MSADIEAASRIVEELAQAIGRAHVLADVADREFHAMDVYGKGETPIAVLRPGSVSELQAIVRIAASRGVAITTRGGGASYTNSHPPSTPRSLVIDTSRLNRIVEINDEDMYVTVEPGVTWHSLWQALAAKGLRTPFWGPFSGLAATVGGSSSQNSASLGSGTYGISADSILGFEIVLANGEILCTGAHAAAKGRPFFRWYGPDLTGLFCGDSGALGIKASITLRLIQAPSCFGAASFGFDDFERMAAGMAAAARAGVTADNFGLDPTLQQGQMGNVSARDAIAAALAVARTCRNPLEAIGRLAGIAVAGRRFLSGWKYSAHYTVEGTSRAEVNSKLAVLRDAVRGHGKEIANTIPTVLRAMPYVPMQTMIGPRGERWVPQHGIVPFSMMNELHRRLARLYEKHSRDMARHKVTKGAMFMTLSSHAFLYEPVLYWEDELTAFHERYLPSEFLSGLTRYSANPEGRALVRELRAGVRETFAEVGAIHLQVGKQYPYMQGRQAQAAQTLLAIKRQLDPQGLMNPGALQLDDASS